MQEYLILPIGIKWLKSKQGARLFIKKGTLFIITLYRLFFVWISCEFVWILPVFSSHATAKMQPKLFRIGKRKACISVLFSKYRLCRSGRGRRTWTLGTRFWSHAGRFSGRVSTFQLVSERISLSGDKWLCLAKCNNRSTANAYINVFDWKQHLSKNREKKSQKC